MSKPTPEPDWSFLERLPAAKRAALRILLPILSGVFFACALPPRNCWSFGWVAFVPLFVAVTVPGIRPGRPLYILGLGLITGLTTGAVQVRWQAAPAGALQFAYLPYVWIALVIGLVAVVADRAREWGLRGLPWTLAVACAGVAVEWLTTFSPLPVGIALCQSRNALQIQIAEFTGIWGVSFLLYLFNAALALAIYERRWRIPSVFAAILLVWCDGVYGLVRMQTVPPSGPLTTVAAIQDFSGADARGLSSTTADSTPTVEKEDLIRDAAHRGAKLIVGSEEAWGSAFRPGVSNDAVAKLARETNSALVVGFSQAAGAAGNGKDWNGAALVASDGATLGIHHKMRLFLGERQTVRAGDRAHAYTAPTIGRVGLLICFDSCYTNAARQAVADGAQIIAMPNYDPPTVNAVLHELHAALIPFRAVENHVAFIRADPNGLSQIVAPNGRIVAETGMYRAEALVAAVPLGDGNGTLFTRCGDWFAWLCFGVSAVSMLTPRSKLRPVPSPP